MDYFNCYTPKLRRYIREHGVKWVDKGINEKSGYMRWVFEQTDELSELLKRYKEES